MQTDEYELLSQAWFPVCRLADVGTGEPLHARILDRDLVVFGSDGRITVADGRCPHRGMALWAGSLCEGALRCPYHGWRFEPATGRCVDIPALEPDELPTHLGIRVHPNRVAYGHVWSCLEEPVTPFPDLPGWSDREWSMVCGIPQEVACGIRQITENFRDLGHLPFVHAATMGDNVTPRVPRYQVRSGGDAVEWSRTAERVAGDAPLKRLSYRVILPSFTSIRTELVGVGTRLLAQIAVPISADGLRTKLFWLAAVDHGLVAAGDIDLDALRDYESRIFDEDVAIVQQCEPAEAPLNLRSQVHTRADRFSVAYRRAYAKLLDDYAATRRPTGTDPPRRDSALVRAKTTSDRS